MPKKVAFIYIDLQKVSQYHQQMIVRKRGDPPFAISVLFTPLVKIAVTALVFIHQIF